MFYFCQKLQQMIKQKFPINALEKAYLKWTYCTPSDIVYLDKSTMLGILFISKFEALDLFNAKAIDRINNFDTSIVLQFNKEDLKERILLSETNIVLLNNILYHAAIESLQQRIGDYVSVGLTQEQAILDFAEDLQLKEDMYEMLRKAAFRDRQNKGIKKVTNLRKLRYSPKINKKNLQNVSVL